MVGPNTSLLLDFSGLRMLEESVSSRISMLRSRSVWESIPRCSRTGRPSRKSSHGRSLSASRMVIFLRNMRPVESSRTILGNFNVLEDVKRSRSFPAFSATQIDTGLMALNRPILFRTAFSAILGDAILSALPLSVLLAPITHKFPSETWTAQNDDWMTTFGAFCSWLIAGFWPTVDFARPSFAVSSVHSCSSLFRSFSGHFGQFFRYCWVPSWR